MERYGLLGKGIGLSLSKKIHEEAAKMLGLEISYEILDVQSNDHLKNLLRELRAGAWKGFNVTTPFKSSVIQFLDYVACNSVNTVWSENGRLCGSSTDGLGFVKGLSILQDSSGQIHNQKRVYKDFNSEFRLYLNDCQLAFLGSGGAVLGILNYLKSIKSESLNKEVFFLVRNMESDSVRNISEFSQVNDVRISMHTSTFDFCKAMSNLRFQTKNQSVILINGIPSKTILSWDTEILLSALPNTISYYDLTYLPMLSDFYPHASRHFKKSTDGLAMLVEQARQSQMIWWGQSPSFEELFQKIS